MAKKPDCSELAKTIAELALNIGTRPEIKTLAEVAAEMEKILPGINRDEIVRSINATTEGYATAKSELSTKLRALRQEARNDRNLRKRIDDLQQHVRGGSLPARVVRNVSAPEEISVLRERRDALKKELNKSDAALRERFGKQIDELTDRLEKGVEAPAPAEAEKLMTSELERLAYERDKLKREIRQRIEAMKPKTWWGKAFDPVFETTSLARSIITSLDFSAVFRQGGAIVLAHPIRGAKSVVPMLRAFRSPVKAHAIHRDIDARPNAPLYARSGLYLAPEEGAKITEHEERFMSRIAGKIPFVAGSERAYNTFLNKLHADSGSSASPSP